MATFEWQVAISYASEDQHLVDPIAMRLVQRGVKIFYDKLDACRTWGKDVYVELSEVFRSGSRYCLMFVSSAYAGKDWTSHERRAIQARALRERGGEYILPIRIDQTPLPGLLETLGSVDIGEGTERICDFIMEKLNESPAPSPSPYVQPVGVSWTQAVPGRAAGAVGWSGLNLDRVYFAHQLQCAPHFQPRPEFFALVEWLRQARQGLFVLVGLGGAGKTAIVEQLVSSLADPVRAQALDVGSLNEHVGASFVFSFYSDATVDGLLSELAEWLHVAPEATLVKRSLRQLGRQASTRGQKLLLVIDGLEEVQQRQATDDLTGRLTDRRLLALLDEIAAGTPGLCAIITTRLQLADLEARERPYYHAQPVGPLDEEAGVRLLRTRGVSGSDADLRQLVAEYAGHALVVDLVANFIVHFHGGDARSFERMEREVVREARRVRTGAGVGTRADIIRREAARLGRIAAFYYQQLETASPSALELLKLVVVFRMPIDVGRSARLTARDADRGNLDTIATNLRALAELGLISAVGDGRYILHPGVRDAFYELISDAEEVGLQRAIVGELKVELEDRAVERKLDPTRIELIRAYVLHLLDLVAQNDSGSEDPTALLKVAWSWLNGTPPDGLGGWRELDWGRAPTATAALEICEAIGRVLDNEGPRTIFIRDNTNLWRVWSHALINLGRLDAALEMDREALRVAKTHGKPAVTPVLDALGSDFMKRGLLRQALDMRQQELEAVPNTRNLHVSLNASLLHARLGEVGAALVALELSLGRLLLSGNYDGYANEFGEGRLARLLLALGDIHGARASAAQAAREAEVFYGVGTAPVADARRSEARALLAMGDHTAATWALEQARNIDREHSLPDSANRRLLEVHASVVAEVSGNGPNPARLSVCKSELDVILNEAGTFGLTPVYQEALVAQAEVELMLGATRRAVHCLKTALYGQTSEATGTTLYDARPLDDDCAPAAPLALSDPETKDPRGIFPLVSSGRPSLLAITHSFCGDRVMEARARLVLARALLMQARETDAPDPLVSRARLELRRCMQVREPFHARAGLRDGDAIYQQARALAGAMERGELAGHNLAYPALAPRSRAPVSVSGDREPTPPTNVLRRYAYSISFPESETFFARELANALGASVGANRVNISPPPEERDTPSAFRLLYEKSFLMDSAVVVIVVPTEVSPDESWVGSSLDRVSDVAAPTQERVVFVRSTKEGAAPLPTAAKQLDRSAPIEDIVEQLGHILAATDEEDRSARRMYYLRFMPKEGQSAYYFVRIGKDTETEFLRALKGKVVFNLEDYGKIIKSGYGEPSPELKQQMKERWNIKYGDEE